MVSAMDGIETELESFLRTVVSIEKERPLMIEVLTSDELKNKDVGYENEPLNCITLQRVYYSFKGETVPGGLQLYNPACEALNHDNITKTTTGCFTNNNEYTFTQAVHFGPRKMSFSDHFCGQTPRDSFRRRKRRSMEAINAQQQGNIRSVKKQRNCEIHEADIAHYPIASETFQETVGKTFEERWSNANDIDTKNRAFFGRIDSLCNSVDICSFNEGTKLCACHDIELQRYNQVTSEKTSCEVLKGKASGIDAVPVMPRCSFSAVPHLQKRHLINNHIKERTNSTSFKSSYDHTTTKWQTEQSQETAIAEETRKGCHTTSLSEADRLPQKLLPHVHNRYDDGTDYLVWTRKCHQGHQASRGCKLATDEDFYAVGLSTSGGDEKVPPKTNFAFSKISKSCSTLKDTEQKSAILQRRTQNIQAFPEISPTVVRDRKQQYFTGVSHWYSKNGLVSQEDSLSVQNVQERPPQQHFNSDREKELTNSTGLGVSPSPDGVERSSNRDISSSSQPSEGIISRRNSFTPSIKKTSSSTFLSSDISNSKSGKNLTLTTKRKIFTCKFQSCSRIFKTRAGLIFHQSLHTGEWYYTCPWENCDRTFRRSDERLRHYRKHTGVKPYECSYCTKCFSRSDHRRTHVKKMHNEEELPVNLANL